MNTRRALRWFEAGASLVSTLFFAAVGLVVAATGGFLMFTGLGASGTVARWGYLGGGGLLALFGGLIVVYAVVGCLRFAAGYLFDKGLREVFGA